ADGIRDRNVTGVQTCALPIFAAAGGKLLKSVNLFDIYRGPGIPAGKKSLAFSLELRADDRTLTDEDTTAVVKKVLDKLEQELGEIGRASCREREGVEVGADGE